MVEDPLEFQKIEVHSLPLVEIADYSHQLPKK